MEAQSVELRKMDPAAIYRMVISDAALSVYSESYTRPVNDDEIQRNKLLDGLLFSLAACHIYFYFSIVILW